MSSKTSGTFSATGQSDAVTIVNGHLVAQLIGTFTGSVYVQASPDSGTSWGDTGDVFTGEIRAITYDPQTGIQYRLDCRSLVSGTPKYFIADAKA